MMMMLSGHYDTNSSVKLGFSNNLRDDDNVPAVEKEEEKRKGEEEMEKEERRMSLRRRKQDDDDEWTPNYREKQEDDVEEEEFGNHSHHGLRKHPCKECANCLVKDCRKCVFCRFGFHISLVGFLQLFSPQRQGQIWGTQCQEAAVHLQREVLEASGDNFLKKNFSIDCFFL